MTTRDVSGLNCDVLVAPEGRIGPTMKICGSLGLPIAIVPCLHRSNVYIKRKLQVWRALKCTPLVGARVYLSPWYCVCTKAINEGTGMESLKM